MNIKYSILIMYKMLLYDSLYSIADLLIKWRNPCEIHQIDYDILLLPTHEKITCKRATCVANNGPCCGGCQYLGDNGCTVKCLGCKLGLCLIASNEHLKLTRLLARMRAVATRQSWCLIQIRTSREKVYQSLTLKRGR